ncbi:MAG: molybdenum cofactor guanylyltransferase [Aestuariibacter sp.]
MGEDKASKRLPDGQTLLQHTCQSLLACGVDDLLVSGYSQRQYKAVSDIHPNAGPVSGILSALHEVANQHLLVMPVDMPCMPVEVLRDLVDFGCENITSCHFQEQCLPLFIHPHDVDLDNIGQLFEQPRSPSIWKLCHLLSASSIVAKNPDSFFNANTPDDWQKVLARLKQST